MGCKQEFLEPDQKADTNKFIANDRTAISREEARAWFLSQYGVKKHVLREDPSGNLEFDIKPVWALSSTGVYGTSTPILVVPVQDIPSLNLGNRSAYFLLFYKDSLSVIQPALVYCVGDDTYADGTKPKTFVDFSGLVMKMDLKGCFQQRTAVAQCGKHLTEVVANPNPSVPWTIWAYEDPFENGGGSIGGVEPGCYHFGKTWLQHLWGSIRDFFGGLGGSGSGGGGNTGGSGIVWNTTNWTPWGAFGGNNGQSGAGGGGGTGNTNTGNVLEQYHFSTLYTNPMFQIEEYFLNMNINGEPFQIFGFLNNDARQFLANEPEFIDIFYDFLVGQGHYPQARAFVAEMIELMIISNMTDLTLVELNYIFDNLLGVELATTPPNNPPLSIGHSICPQILSFKTYENEVTHDDLAALVLSNSYFQFNVPGAQSFVLTIPRLNFEAFANSNNQCLESCSLAAANAINFSVAKAQQFINNQPAGTPNLPDLVRPILLINLDKEFLNQVKSCNSGYTTNVGFVSEITSIYPGVSIVDYDAQIVNCQ